ncbi:hypothetical protein B0H13DRAFT_1917064 [Mycena leptocephala]|nr:hypothetical protein B0H13DRAFT_1917064 [Mycena leptocephala]
MCSSCAEHREHVGRWMGESRCKEMRVEMEVEGGEGEGRPCCLPSRNSPSGSGTLHSSHWLTSTMPLLGRDWDVVLSAVSHGICENEEGGKETHQDRALCLSFVSAIGSMAHVHSRRSTLSSKNVCTCTMDIGATPIDDAAVDAMSRAHPSCSDCVVLGFEGTHEAHAARLHTADELCVEEDTDGEHDDDALAEHGVANEAHPDTEAHLDAQGEETMAASRACGAQGDWGRRWMSPLPHAP